MPVDSALSSNSSFVDFLLLCRTSAASIVIHTAYVCVNVLLLLPLFILILCLGVRRWRRLRPAGSGMSHTHFFTYNMMLVEIAGVLGSVVYAFGNFMEIEALLVAGTMLSSIMLSGQTLFHLLTCVERYLAVVHPIAYMKHRDAIGLKVRNIATACVWVVCVGWMWTVEFITFHQISFFSGLSVSISVVLFCCASVLSALVRPGPGDAGGTRGRVDPSKRKAFQTTASITAALLLRSVGVMFWFSVINVVSTDSCVMVDSGIWLMVPGSLVLPVLYLQRAGKLSCRKQAVPSE